MLLINELNAAPYADEFLRYILTNYPDTTYWLTTHCWQGINRTHEVLSPALKPESMELLGKIKATEWGQAKTEAIDFSKPFLWFDDDLYPEEKSSLVAHNTLANWIEINLAVDPERLQKLITSLPAPVQPI